MVDEALPECANPRSLDAQRGPSQDHADLVAWVEALPGADLTSSALRICESAFAGVGNAVVAGRDLPPGGLVARIPRAAALTCAAAAVQEPFISELAAACRVASLELPSGVALLRLYLIHAKHRPEAWHHLYVRTLPESLGSPLFWNETGLAHLIGTPLAARVQGLRATLWAEFRGFWRPLSMADPGHFPSEVFSFRALAWAQGTCSSRALPPSLAGLPPDDFVMCPILDLLNHRGDAPMDWRGVERSEGDGIEFRIPEGSQRTIRAGQEIWNDYGAHSNEDFLMGFGFCPENNKFDKLELFVVVTGPAGRLSHCKAELERRYIPLRLANRCEEQLCLGPFALSRASVGSTQVASLRLPSQLLASLDILMRGEPTAARARLLAAFSDLVSRYDEASGGDEMSPCSDLSLDEHCGSCTDVSKMYRESQQALLREGLLALERLSEEDFKASASRFHANSRFLDRLEGKCSDLALGTASSPDGGMDKQIALRLCLSHEVETQITLTAGELEEIDRHLGVNQQVVFAGSEILTG